MFHYRQANGLQDSFIILVHAHQDIVAQRVAEQAWYLRGVSAARRHKERAGVRHTLGFCLWKTGRPEEAIPHLVAACRLAPDRVISRQVLADTCVAAGRHAEALSVLREGLGSRPGHAGLAVRLAFLLATSPDASLRDGPQSMRILVSIARGKLATHPLVLAAIAAAQAENGDPTEAAETAGRALAEAEKRKETQLAERIRRQITTYEAGRPFRE